MTDVEEEEKKAFKMLVLLTSASDVLSTLCGSILRHIDQQTRPSG